MNVAENFSIWVVAVAILAVVGLGSYILSHHFSPESRERRRCRRNHRKVISRARRPAVMLSAKTPRAES
jgi:hypothetical protein